MAAKNLNAVYSSVSARRRYEVWFLRLGLADGSGAWWFRYLLFNPGRDGCRSDERGMPVQVWATWFPRDGKPHSFIKGFPLQSLELSAPGLTPFRFRAGDNEIGENSCRGALEVEGHRISWDLSYRSTFGLTLSNKGWIGFSRTPHCDAVFSGKVILDGQVSEGAHLGIGLQGHNCGYRHRSMWRWAHAHFPASARPASTLEALVYDLPFGLVFRKAVLWHEGKQHVFRNLRDLACNPGEFAWNFHASTKDGVQLEARFDGAGTGMHRLPYRKTDCSGSFAVVNNSLAKAVIRIQQPGRPREEMETQVGGVLEKAGGPDQSEA
jgi:hypothetical protein